MARISATKSEEQVHEAQLAVADAERSLAAARRLLEEASGPKLAKPSTSVIRFQKRFANSTRIYRYAAINIGGPGGGNWFLTGAESPQGMTWERLSKFIVKDNELEPQYVELFEIEEALPF